jgi:pimeloyl-ACP methyl ester carboxylesterase
VTTILGFAYATTSYQENGLVVVDATKDLQRLVAKFRELYGPIGGDTYAVGVSEGGLIATLATERHSQLFDGTLAVCAPIGDFRRQLDYFQNFRLAFDSYFGAILAQSGIFLGSPTDIPEDVIAAFGTPSQPGPLALAIAAVVSNPQLWPTTNALLTAAGIPVQVDASNVTLITQLILRLLAYNILYTNNVQDVLGGDVFAGDQSALSHLRAMYETSGRLKSPLVTLYNINDPIVPSWNEETYRDKVEAAGALDFLIAQIGSTQFGHCEFTLQEVLQAFGTLAQAVTGEQLAARRQ